MDEHFHESVRDCCEKCGEVFKNMQTWYEKAKTEQKLSEKFYEHQEELVRMEDVVLVRFQRAKKKRPKNDREDLKRLLSKSNIEEVTVKVSLPKMYKFFDTWAKDHIGHKVGSNSKDLIVYLMKLVQDHDEFKVN